MTVIPQALGRGEEPRVILVVDDDPLVRGLVCKLLSRRGYHSIEAASGEEAAAVVDENLNSLQLVISDIIMPGMCGIQLTQWLRKKAPFLPILLMTAFVHVDLGAALDSPPPVLCKPFRPEALFAQAEKLMQIGGPWQHS